MFHYLRFCIVCPGSDIHRIYNFVDMWQKLFFIHRWEVMIVQSQNSWRSLSMKVNI